MLHAPIPALFLTLFLCCLKPVPISASEEAPIDLWILVDGSGSFEVSNEVENLLRLIWQHLNPDLKDRGWLYTFDVQARMQEENLQYVNPEEWIRRLIKGLVSPRNKTHFVTSFSSLRADLDRSVNVIKTKDVEDRKRIIMIITDGISDIGDRFDVTSESCPSREMIRELEDQKEKIPGSVKELRKRTVGAGTRRYFEVVVFIHWPEKNICPHARTRVVEFWQGAMREVPTQFLSKNPKERVFDIDTLKPDALKNHIAAVFNRLREPRGLMLKSPLCLECAQFVPDKVTKPSILQLTVLSTLETPRPWPKIEVFDVKEGTKISISYDERKKISPIREDGPSDSQLSVKVDPIIKGEGGQFKVLSDTEIQVKINGLGSRTLSLSKGEQVLWVLKPSRPVYFVYRRDYDRYGVYGPVACFQMELPAHTGRVFFTPHKPMDTEVSVSIAPHSNCKQPNQESDRLEVTGTRGPDVRFYFPTEGSAWKFGWKPSIADENDLRVGTKYLVTKGVEREAEFVFIKANWWIHLVSLLLLIAAMYILYELSKDPQRRINWFWKLVLNFISGTEKDRYMWCLGLEITLAIIAVGIYAVGFDLHRFVFPLPSYLSPEERVAIEKAFGEFKLVAIPFLVLLFGPLALWILPELKEKLELKLQGMWKRKDKRNPLPAAHRVLEVFSNGPILIILQGIYALGILPGWAVLAILVVAVIFLPIAVLLYWKRDLPPWCGRIPMAVHGVAAIWIGLLLWGYLSPL